MRASPQEEKATAARAVYDGATQRLTLTGKVQVTDAGSVLWADRVAMEQQTGDAEADGSVKASYKLSGGGSEPVHVLAARAVLKHDAGQAIFYGAERTSGAALAGRLRRWRLRCFSLIRRRSGWLRIGNWAGRGDGCAYGAGECGGLRRPVRESRSAGKTEVVRVASRELTYSDETRQAEFTGGVRGRECGWAHARAAGRGLFAGAPRQRGKDRSLQRMPRAAGQSGFMGGSVERMVATGNIEIDQPGRRATGERVVYTASDGMFVMTGTAAAPPKIVDDTRGTVTGTSLRFHAGDESVMVSNGVSNGVESKQRVRTETRVKKDR